MNAELAHKVAIAFGFINAAETSSNCLRKITMIIQKGKVQIIRQPTNSVG